MFPQVEENLLQNITRLREVEELYKQSVALHLKKLVEQKGSEIHIPVLKWKKTAPLQTITWEIIKQYGFNAQQTEEVIKLLDAENGAYKTSATHRIIRNRQWMIISSTATETAAHILIEAGQKNIVFENGSITIQNITDPQIPNDKAATQTLVDAAEIQFPLLLRKWKQGDYFYPLGMEKKKKLSRFFIDSKLSRTD